MFRSLYNFTFLYANFLQSVHPIALQEKTAPQEAFLLRGFLAAAISY